MNENLDNSSIDQESVTSDVLSSVTPLPKPKITKIIMRYCLLVFGGVLLALGAGIFLAPLNIVSGGLSGIAIIVDYFLPGYLDITIWILTGVFFILGFIFLGKTFAFRTLVASLVYPAVLTLVYRIDFFQQLAKPLVDGGTTGDILVGGLFGGAFTGVGCALTFLGGGSTGGVDNLTFIINKFTGIKQSTLSFVIDALIIVIGMIVMWGDGGRFIACLVGILSALACAMMIEYIYIGGSHNYIADIISEKWEEINDYVQETLGRGATIIDVYGGYQLAKRRMVRVAFDRKEYQKLVDAIARIDPKAFVTFTNVKAINGEGFLPFPNPGLLKKHTDKKDENKDKN